MADNVSLCDAIGSRVAQYLVNTTRFSQKVIHSLVMQEECPAAKGVYWVKCQGSNDKFTDIMVVSHNLELRLFAEIEMAVQPELYKVRCECCGKETVCASPDESGYMPEAWMGGHANDSTGPICPDCVRWYFTITQAEECVWNWKKFWDRMGEIHQGGTHTLFEIVTTEIDPEFLHRLIPSFD